VSQQHELVRHRTDWSEASVDEHAAFLLFLLFLLLFPIPILYCCSPHTYQFALVVLHMLRTAIMGLVARLTHALALGPPQPSLLGRKRLLNTTPNPSRLSPRNIFSHCFVFKGASYIDCQL
jgi:hypothetical protein